MPQYTSPARVLSCMHNTLPQYCKFETFPGATTASRISLPVQLGDGGDDLPSHSRRLHPSRLQNERHEQRDEKQNFGEENARRLKFGVVGPQDDERKDRCNGQDGDFFAGVLGPGRPAIVSDGMSVRHLVCQFVRHSAEGQCQGCSTKTCGDRVECRMKEIFGVESVHEGEGG